MTGALGGKQPRILDLVRDSATPSDRKLALQSGKGLNRRSWRARVTTVRPCS